ncbi:MAG: cupin domain-containing protein [Acidimicrobiia bacterium]|nr:cupin domain-containing protein [Acidimicrobiia bacterium]
MSAGVVVPKPWGSELIWAHTDDYAAKILTIGAGRRLSLQFHEFKAETIFVAEGKLLLHFGPTADEIETKEMVVGDSFHVPVGLVHRFEAIEDTKLIEVSTPQLDDVVRLSDDFGREGTTEP